MNTKNTLNNRVFLVICLALITIYFLIDSSAYRSIRNFFSSDSQKTTELNHFPKATLPLDAREPWITIFVHGSFGSLIGLLSFTRVLKDDLYGSLYKDINKRMRQDSFFYKDQSMLQRGLVSIKPTFNIQSVDNKKYAVYPIIKAYEMIQDIVKPNKERSFFYTFGWSGLMSQYRRRLEAVRFYNELHEELETFKAKGITPKIRILAHSHGGNLCLNLAAISHFIHTPEGKPFMAEGQTSEGTKSLEKMQELLRSLPLKEKCVECKGQRRYDYKPTASLRIQELIVLGTPIQPETEFFCLSDVFEKFYNIYSEEDAIQKLDCFSTKQYKSEQRIHDNFLALAKDKHKIMQAKIMYGRPVDGQELLDESVTTTSTVSDTAVQPLWKKISGFCSIFSKKFQDPGHKELWFASWQHDRDNQSFLAPLPAVIFVPLIISLLDQSNELIDIDINVSMKKNDLDISTLKHNDSRICHSTKLPVAIINQLKEKFKPWDPQDLLEKSGMEAIYKHIL